MRIVHPLALRPWVANYSGSLERADELRIPGCGLTGGGG